MAQAVKWKQPFHWGRRFLAKQWLLLFPRLTVIAVTGSYGKTSTARAINSVLSQKYSTLITDLNLDTIYNLPITLLKVRPKHQKLILELGVDHRGEMASYLQLVRPNIGVVTGITPVHSNKELLGSLSGIINEKGRLLEALPEKGYAILNRDDKHVRSMAEKTKAQKIYYGLGKAGDSQIWAEKIKVSTSATEFTLHFDTLGYGNERKRLKTGLVGRHFVHSCLVAAAVGRLEGLSWQEINKGLARLKPLKGRVSLGKGPLGSVLINDALRANPASTLAGLQVLVDLPTRGKRIAVLGEMGELGRSAKKCHQEVGQKVAKLGIDYLVAIGPLQKLTAESAQASGMKKDRAIWMEGVHGAAETLKTIIKPGDLLYLKGSLLRHLERVLLLLRGKSVGCTVTSCEFYHPCSSCPYLKAGLE